MKIKEDRELKFPQIMFHTVYANFMFIFVLGMFFVNWVLYIGDIGHLRLIPIGLTIFGIVAFYLIMIGSVGEGFTKNSPQNHFQDLKRSVIYMMMTVAIFIGIHYYSEANKIIPPPEKLVAERSVKIVELSIFDIHEKTIKYAIGYKDSNGTTRWQSNFTALDDRTDYLNTLVKSDKFKVEIYFKISKHNRGSLEIIKQTIKG